MKKYYIINELKEESIKAFKSKDYLQAAIIIFQTVEALLRGYIGLKAKGMGINEKIKRIITEDEISFSKLVLYLNLLDPKNPLINELDSLNKDRNKIIHRSFEYKKIEDYKDALKKLCFQGLSLNIKFVDLFKTK
ncbi:MAG: hypothetical protein WC882_01525 [Candidatus Gracilibacteria bacterium]